MQLPRSEEAAPSSRGLGRKAGEASYYFEPKRSLGGEWSAKLVVAKRVVIVLLNNLEGL